MHVKKLIFTIAALLIFSGSTRAGREDFPRNKVIDTVPCLDNPKQTYSLYLPSEYDDPPPLVVFLEPGARGKLPLGLYKGLAEHFGFILACSNNGSNGPPELYENALDAMIPDLITRLRPDTARLFLCGFSGGARYASIYSSRKQKAGVVACGAGRAPYGGVEQLKLPFYTCIAGREDMNFIDAIRSVKEARELNTPAWMVHCDGGHFWPDTVSVRRAFEQVLVYWHTNGLYHLPDNELEQIRLDIYAQFDSLLLAKRYYEVDVMEANLKVNPLYDPEDARWLDIASRIPFGKEQKKNRRQWEKVKSKEMRFQDSIFWALDDINLAIYNQTGQMRPLGWWKDKGKQVRRVMDSNDSLTKESGYRMYDFTCRNLWSWGLMHLGDQLEPYQAERYYRAWCSFAPNSPEAFYWLAGAYGAGGKDEEALKSLETAVEKGFSRADRIEKAGAFKALHKDQRYQELIRKIGSH